MASINGANHSYLVANAAISENVDCHALIPSAEVCAPDQSTRKATPMSRPSLALSMASEGVPVRIHALHGEKGLSLRLTELGLNVGAQIAVVQRQGGGVLIARGETRIANEGDFATLLDRSAARVQHGNPLAYLANGGPHDYHEGISTWMVGFGEPNMGERPGDQDTNYSRPVGGTETFSSPQTKTPDTGPWVTLTE